jgi:hypothetical protein
VMEHTQKLPDVLTPFYQQIAPYAQVFRKTDRTFVEHQAEETFSTATAGGAWTRSQKDRSPTSESHTGNMR